MSIRAVYFDLGGVIVRTEDKGPRTALGKSVGLGYDEIDEAVFGCESAQQASIGAINVQQHWDSVAQALNLPTNDMPRFSEAFFAGDRTDWALIDFLRSLRPAIKTGLISNAWPHLREWIIEQKFDDAFDDMTISAEVGATKPDARIYQQALKNLSVRPEEAIFVDDMPINIEAAKTLGMHGILFRKPEEVIVEIQNLINKK